MKIASALKADLFLPSRLSLKTPSPSLTMESLGKALRENFKKYRGHVVVAAAGLVVREIAPLLESKRSDPAVVVLGQDGAFVVSLLSGHLGGGNDLARRVAEITGGRAVVSTATDIAGVPALEVLARDRGLGILDFKKLPAVSRTLAEGGRVPLYDPEGFLAEALEPWEELFPRLRDDEAFAEETPRRPRGPSLYVDYRLRSFPKEALVLAPKVLALGVGCHRGIEFSALWSFVGEVFSREKLALEAVALVATAEIRQEEPAILELARELGGALAIFKKSELAEIKPPNPSETVLRRIGVPSVCEAAAMLAARTDRLLVPKQKSASATLALAKTNSTSSAWGPRAPRA
jgi:cobalt-precorrin 5A hydrolase